MSKNLIIDDNDFQLVNENVGNKLEDFEILQTLGKGGYGFVAKVKSKKNHKLYAMKMIDFSLIKDPGEINLSLNEIKIIQSLNSPHIIKYYNSFINQNSLYIIMEYMNNGDLKGYINAHQNMKKPIPEEELWELFYQCAAGLSYIHRNNLIHRDIKPANLFMTENKSIKIGDFGVSAIKKNKNFGNFQMGNNKETLMIGTPFYMSPEMFTHQGYGNKVDIYALGVTFYEMCFYSYPREFINYPIHFNLRDIPPKFNINYYSNQMVKLIQWMIQREPNKRPSSGEVLEYIKNIYKINNKNNSTIDCVYRCLYSFQNLTNYIKDNNQIKNQLQIRPISNSLLYAIKKLNKNKWPSYLNTLRDILTYENPCFPDPGLIEPIDLIKFILKRMHKESILNKYINSDNPYIIIPDNPSILNYQNSLQNYLNVFQNYKSCVSDFFFGTYEIIKLCNSCNTKRYYFKNFFYLNFNIDEALKNGLSENNSFIINYFFKQNSLIVSNSSFCYFCKNITYHQETKKFFTLPYNLIICFSGEKPNYDNKYIKYSLIVDFSKLGIKCNPFIYNLKGIIKCYFQNEKKYYICIYQDYGQKQWVMSDGYSKSFIDTPFNHNIGDIIMLFYSSFK